MDLLGIYLRPKSPPCIIKVIKNSKIITSRISTAILCQRTKESLNLFQRLNTSHYKLIFFVFYSNNSLINILKIYLKNFFQVFSRKYIFILKILLFFVFELIGNSSSIFSNTSINNNKIYYPEVATGKYQKIGTLTQICTGKKLLEINKNADTAIILVPGLNSVKLSNCLYEWGDFWKVWQKRPEIQAKYKLLVFRYDGWDSLYNSSDILTQGIHEFLKQETEIKYLIFIGYSQGGIIPRIILSKNQDLNNITLGVITLATDHQGATILSEKLQRDIIKKEILPTKPKNLLALEVLKSRYKYAFKEQAWTNFDSGIPKSANYTPPVEALNIPVPENTSQKFITYGSYFYSTDPFVNLGRFINFIFDEAIPKNIFLDSKAGQHWLNRIMRTKIYADEKPEFRAHMAKNDGVTPLASALWAKICDKNEIKPESWQRIFPENNFCPVTERYRVFEDITHLEWREAPKYRKLRDIAQLSKNKQKNTPKLLYDWIIDDIESLSKKTNI